MQDAELLREYAKNGSQAAFTEVVKRYVNFVYSAARRQVGEAHLAEEVAQSVFCLLARKAGAFRGQPTLAGWLYRATYFTAAKALRTEKRRQQREREAAEMNQRNSEAGDVWEHLWPVLDEALNQLGEKDRLAVLLRFFQRKPMREVGEVLGVSEAAAKMRVARAVERLKEFFARRGVACSSAALGILLTEKAVEAAPAAAIPSITAAVWSGAAASTVPTLSFIQTLMLIPKIKATTFAVAGIGGVLVLTVVLYSYHAGRKPAVLARTPEVAANAVVETNKLDSRASARASESKGVLTSPASEQSLLDAIRQDYTYDNFSKFVSVFYAHLSEVNARDGEGKTPLHWAAIKGHNEAALLLLLHGAEPNVQDQEGYTPLMYSVLHRQTYLLRLLALKGANVNLVNREEMTALSLAVTHNLDEYAECLLWLGAEIDPTHISAAKAPLALARSKANAQIIRLLETYSTEAASTFASNSKVLPSFAKEKFQSAAQKADFETLENMLAAGADINAKDANGFTALQRAIQAEQDDVVFYLLMIGANPNLRSSNDHTPLMQTMGWLGMGGLDAMRRYLLVKGAVPNANNSSGWSEITWACERDNEHSLRLLLWLGVDPKVAGPKGTPFQIAARGGNQRLIKILQDAGVNESIPQSDDPAQNLANAAKRGDIPSLEKLLDAGVAVDTADESGGSALMLAIEKRNVAAARYLISRGADINYTNPKTGWTPLFMTIIWSYTEMTDFRKELLEARANPNVKSKQGITPLMRSLWHTPSIPMIQLLEHGADINARDAQGRTPLRIALDEGKTETAEFLRQKGGTE